MTDDIQALEARLSALEADARAEVREKIDALNDLAWALSDTDLKRAHALSETAYTLASSPDDGHPAYQIGMAYSLRTQGYLNQRLGDYPLGLTQLLKAQDMCESLQLDDGLTDVFDGIAGIYYQISNLSEALNYMYRQLEVAQRIGDRRRIANAYNNLANIYFETGDYERAVETLHYNLQTAAETDFKRIESLSYLNLAETYLLAGNYQEALENASRALRVSQEAGFEVFEVYAFDFIGKAYLKLGDALQAIHHLEKGLALSRRVDSKVTESLILLNMGQAYRDTQQFDLALDWLQQGRAVAEAIDARGELYKIHLLMSEICEQRGDMAQALYHFRQYHSVKESLFNEKADERLKVLQVVHDTETARSSMRFWQSVLDALSADIAILDEAGTIIAVNAPWRRFAEDNRLGWADYGIGRNYLSIAEAASRDEAEGAREAATGIREVLAGVSDRFQMQYPCHSPTEERWFAMNVTGFQSSQGIQVVVAHENITARVRTETARKRAEEALKRQFRYEKALAECSQTLHRATEHQPFDQDILNEAMGHLMEGVQADRAYVYRNFDDPEDGFCSGIVAEAVRPGLPQDLYNPFFRKIPWSSVPEENRLKLEAGDPCGGPTHQLFASSPQVLEILQKESIQSVQFFPIHFGDTWWGYLGFDDCQTDREWEDSEIRLLRTASELISNVLQRWRAEAALREANEMLAQRVAERTAKLDETVVLLRQEVAERKQAETEVWRRLNVERRLATISTQLMQATNFGQAVVDTLAETGQLIDASRLFLFRPKNGGWTADTVDEWCAPEVEPIFGDVHGLSLEDDSWLIRTLRQEGGFQVEDFSQFPAEVQERVARFEAGAGEARLALPVYAGEEMIGFLGCHGLARSDPKYEQNLKTLEVVVGMLGNAWQREQALATLEQHVVARTRELSAFFDLTTLDSDEHDLTEVLEPAINRILELGHCRAICIHVLDEDRATLRLAVGRNLPDGAESRMREVAPHQDFARLINHIGDPVMTTELASFRLIPSQLRLDGFQTYLGTHLQAGGRAQGWVSYYRASARGFGLNEMSILVALAEQIGVIVENHRLRQRIQEMAVLEERQRLARDLHDSVTQSLYSLTLFTRAGHQAAQDGDATRLSDNLADLETTALQALRQMRLLLYELRPAVLEQEGLVRALDLRFDTVERRAGMQVDYRIEGDIDLPQPVETELYHLTIEALNNTLKHAMASRVSVCLCSSRDRFELMVTDDGCGFDPAQAHNGLGLRSMRERVERMGGRLEILSAPGAGTQVAVRILDKTP